MESAVRSLGALGTNPALGEDRALSVHGSDWLWAVTALFYSLAASPCPRPTVFSTISSVTLLVGSVSYFAQAADLGWSAVAVSGGTVTRQISWAKYANWAVSFPTAALALGLLSDVSWTTIFTNIFTCLLWVVTYVILAMSTLGEGREAAQRVGIGCDYILLAAVVNAAWFLYPISWALGDGSNTIGVTGSFVFTGIIDMLQLPFFACAFVLMARKWNFASLNLDLSESRSGWKSQRPHKASDKAGPGIALVSQNSGEATEAV
ncbi:opsin related protein [Ophiostoma piceae UAMH 11346]|uniref:Opsin related protein n=1 Tax=Ophiostoma piceae (strain UAMH 11346) TaxID=1262450 RepID=S3C6V6_OPHP1|nr:opsin related protein [Ophiostoma piceae UAMH 11346]